VAITLRIASRSLPPAAVVQIAPDIQYSSHVVNIVLPNFGDGFLRDDLGFDLPRVSQRFFQEFEDSLRHARDRARGRVHCFLLRPSTAT
jgi:hypothetical protein